MTDQEIQDRIVARGKRYYPRSLPSDLQHMELRRCYDNSLLQAIRSAGKYRYVEGYAKIIAYSGDFPEGWIQHAWLTDGVNAYDVTWYAVSKTLDRKLPILAEYIGIEFETEDAALFVKTTEYMGIIANRHRAPELFAQIAKLP